MPCYVTCVAGPNAETCSKNSRVKRASSARHSPTTTPTAKAEARNDSRDATRLHSVGRDDASFDGARGNDHRRGEIDFSWSRTSGEIAVDRADCHLFFAGTYARTRFDTRAARRVNKLGTRALKHIEIALRFG